jgi:hypothetical protein
MFRPAASGVSALSGSVANDRQAVHHVSFSPSKIPYGGFSPVRLQAGRRRQPSPPVSPPMAYMPPKLLRFPLTLARSGNRRTVSASRRNPSKHTGPEALGSASGCSVPPRHRLLWPHPRLWASPAGLCSSAGGSLPKPRPRDSPI